MTDLAQNYEQVITGLLPHFSKPGFDAELKAMAEKCSITDIFMIKMEVNRRMAPCNKRLDLRGKVPGEVREYQFNDERCWLDDLALNHYRQRVALYGGSLTIGLWEELQPTAEMRNKLFNAQGHKFRNGANLSAEYFRAGHGILRKESRYKFFASIEIVLQDGSLVHGNTLDISLSGLKVKATAAFNYQENDIVSIRFVKLDEMDVVPELLDGVMYSITQIRDYSYSSHFITLGLKIVSPSDAINTLIDNQRNREVLQNLATDKSHRIEQVKYHALEKAVVNHTTSLALFLESGKIRFALINPMNHAI